MDECDCLEDFYEWVWLFTAYLWEGVTVNSIFMGWCSGCWWELVDMTGCGWVGKMVKPPVYFFL